MSAFHCLLLLLSPSSQKKCEQNQIQTPRILVSSWLCLFLKFERLIKASYEPFKASQDDSHILHHTNAVHCQLVCTTPRQTTLLMTTVVHVSEERWEQNCWSGSTTVCGLPGHLGQNLQEGIISRVNVIMISVYFKVYCTFLEKGFSAKHCYPVAAAVHVEPQVWSCAVRVSEQLPVCLFLDLHSEGAVLANPLLSSASEAALVISAGHSIN